MASVASAASAPAVTTHVDDAELEVASLSLGTSAGVTAYAQCKTHASAKTSAMTSESSAPSATAAAVAAAAGPRKPRSLADLLDEQVKTGAVKKEDLARPVWADQRPPPRSARPPQQQPWGDGQRRQANSSSLNWQQQEMVDRDNRRPAARQYEGGRPARSYAPASESAAEVKTSDSDMPAWAMGDMSSGNTSASSGLNWQQQSLLKRDDSDPFNRFVRGENEFVRE